MILADKIINERKRCGWSQEELAEKLSVSRQSVSKWEGAQAIPDLQKILKMAELFNVTTDYLLKDEIEGTPVEGTGYSEDRDYNVRKVSIEEANDYLDTVRQNSPRVALGVMLCVLSPLFLIFLLGFAGAGFIGETASVTLGLAALFACIAAAVFMFIIYGGRIGKFDYLQKEEFETAYGVDGMVREKQSKTAEFYTKLIVAGVLLCILSPVPLVLCSVMAAPGFVILYMVCVLLAMIAFAVFLFVTAGSITDSYKILLKEKEFTKENKKADRIRGAVAGPYWLVTTAVFLYFGFVHDGWNRYWIIWPIAGVLFAAVMTVLQAFLNKEE
ncbi:MAG: helix-turn-helix domain-containing protein [Lachnospiraceae bacterium]|nr:helix-turn-helix domain-containing protein [Lachnospiraceae bacterium]